MSEKKRKFVDREDAISFLEARGFTAQVIGDGGMFEIPVGAFLRSEDLTALMYLRDTGDWDFEQV
jgi:hypothetical protein